jgi:hypothetical protein
MVDSGTAVVDASVVYGAARYLRADPAASQSTHARGYDRSLFLEFLHDLLLYDRIILDNSSVTIIGDEIRDLREGVNRHAGWTLLELKELTTIKTNEIRLVESAVARLVAAHPDPESLEALRLPWAYSDPNHVDRPDFVDLASEYRFPEKLVPFAIFVFRGFCYAGFANGLADGSQKTVAYLAAPGRVTAFEKVASNDFVNRVKHAREAYSALLKQLPLPRSGYEFDTFLPKFMAHEVSALAQAVLSGPPAEAVEMVLQMRNTNEADIVRSEWSKRLRNYEHSSVVGAVLSQSIRDATITGDVNLYMTARPYSEGTMGKNRQKADETTAKNEQIIDDAYIGGAAKLTATGADLGGVKHVIRKSDVEGGADMRIDQESNRLNLGKHSAQGRLAVIALAIVAIVALVAWLLPKVIR